MNVGEKVFPSIGNSTLRTVRLRIKNSTNLFAGDACRVSIILPAYNEEGKISKVIEALEDRMDGASHIYEIIVVDDGSVDGTRREAIEASRRRHVKVVGYETNMGKGYALRYGLGFSRGSFVIFLDSDLEIDLSNIDEYLRALKVADIVIASKRHPLSGIEQPILRRVFSFSFHVVVRFVTGLRFSDTQTGLKAFRSEAIRRILPLLLIDGYAFDVELLSVASLLNLRILELPIFLRLDSMFNPRHIPGMVSDLIRIFYRLRVSKWYQTMICLLYC